MFGRPLRYLLFSLLVTSLSGCFSGEGVTVKPTALGVMNEITVVCDQSMWSGIVGQAVENTLGGVYPITPRPESMFDLRYYSPEQLRADHHRRQLRTYLIIGNLSDSNSVTTDIIKNDLGSERVERVKADSTFRTSIGRDKWAFGQLVIYLFGNTDEEIVKALKDNFGGISSKVNNHDAKQLYQYTYARGKNPGISRMLTERYGITLDIPVTYQVALDSLNEDKLLWLRKDIESGIVNLVFREYPYRNTDQLDKDYIRQRFDSFGRKFVTSDTPNSYLVSNPNDLPVLEFNRTISGHYVKEVRGIWEMVNEFLGGPYQSYAIVNEHTGKLLIVDGFILMPGLSKRNLMQEIDLIVNSIKW